MVIIFLLLLLGAIIVEGTMTTLPLVLVCLLCLTILTRDTIVFLVAFVAGIFLDAFALRSIGGTSIFLLLFVFLILLYQRKYEIYSYQFVMVAAFIGSVLFLKMFGYDGILFQAGLVAIITGILFAGVRGFRLRRSSRDKGSFV